MASLEPFLASVLIPHVYKDKFQRGIQEDALLTKIPLGTSTNVDEVVCTFFVKAL